MVFIFYDNFNNPNEKIKKLTYCRAYKKYLAPVSLKYVN